jgi:hypothetical protein
MRQDRIRTAGYARKRLSGAIKMQTTGQPRSRGSPRVETEIENAARLAARVGDVERAVRVDERGDRSGRSLNGFVFEQRQVEGQSHELISPCTRTRRLFGRAVAAKKYTPPPGGGEVGLFSVTSRPSGA